MNATIRHTTFAAMLVTALFAGSAQAGPSASDIVKAGVALSLVDAGYHHGRGYHKNTRYGYRRGYRNSYRRGYGRGYRSSYYYGGSRRGYHRGYGYRGYRSGSYRHRGYRYGYRSRYYRNY